MSQARGYYARGLPEGGLREQKAPQRAGADAGVQHGGARWDRKTQEKIPTLKEVFDLIKDKIMINVEIKTERFRSTGVEIPVIDMIKQNRLTDSVVVSSFSPVVLERIHLHAPEIKLGFLYSERSFLNDFWAKKLGKFAWHPEWHLVGEKLVKKAKELNRLVYTWTVDNPDDLQKLSQLQVKGIISNKPENFVK